MSLVGRAQFFSNALASTVAYIVAVGIGFIMPRLIYEAVGKTELGVWDLGWSFLVYFTFSGVGFGPAIAHFVSSGYATPDETPISETILTGFCCQLVFALLTSGAFIWGVMFMSQTLDILAPPQAALIQQIGWLIGMTIGVVIVGDVTNSVLIAFHKARVSEFINITHDVSLAICMVAVLSRGYGIFGLALATLVLRIFIELVRAWIVIKISPQFSRSAILFSTHKSFDLFKYALKSSASVFQELFVFQSVRLILFLSSGPIALASFSRYVTIGRQINRLVDRIGISIPTIASGFYAEGQLEKVKSLYLNSAQVGVMITLPMLTVFCIFGDDIVALWMGKEFVLENVAWILAGGALLHANYSICTRILSGLNAHGNITLLCLFFSGLTLLVLAINNLPQSAVESAAVIAIVMLFTVHLPYLYFASARLPTPILTMILSVYLKPTLVNFLFGLGLLSARNLLSHGNYLVGFLVLVLSVMGLTFGYWFFTLELKAKEEFRSFIKTTREFARKSV